MPKNNILYGIPVLGERLRNFMRRNKYKMTAQSLYDDVIENIERGATEESEYGRIINNKELKNLLNKEFTKDRGKTSVSGLLQRIEQERLDRLKISSVKEQQIANYVIVLSRVDYPLSYEEIMKYLDNYIPSIEEWNKIFMIKVMDGEKETTLCDLLDSIKLKESTKLSQQQQLLLSSRGSNASVVSNASWHSAKTSFGDYDKRSLREQYSLLPPIVAKPKIEPVKPFTEEKYEEAIKEIETANKIGKLSCAFGVKNKGEKEELAGLKDFTSSVSKDISFVGMLGRVTDANSFSSKCEDNFNTCKTDYATMLQFCHIKDIMDLKENIVINKKGKREDLGNRKLHDALSNSEFSASLFLTDKTVKLNKPEVLNDVYTDLTKGGLNAFNTIAGDILSGAKKTENNKEMRDILDANIKFYSDDNVDKNGKKYSTKSQEATNEVLEKSKICKDIIIELVLKNPDAMQNINIMICNKEELKEYADKTGTSFNNGNIKKLFVEKMPQKIQEWHKWIELGKDIDCDLYPEFGKFKQNVYELSQEYIKDLDNKPNNTVDFTKKENIKKFREDFKKSLKAAFPDIETVRQV